MEQLEGRDLAVTKISINMGKTSNDALGRVNPVEKMLFYHKGNLQAREIKNCECRCKVKCWELREALCRVTRWQRMS